MYQSIDTEYLLFNIHIHYRHTNVITYITLLLVYIIITNLSNQLIQTMSRLSFYTKLGTTTTIISIILLLTTYLLPSYILDRVQYGIDSNLVQLTQTDITNNTLHYQMWSNSSNDYNTQQYLLVHIYNITNPVDIVNDGVKPIVQQLQPIRFNINRYRYNITFDTDIYTQQNILYYNEYKYYTLDDTYNTTTYLNTRICTVNIILQGIYTVFPSSLTDLYPNSLYNDVDRLFATITVNDLLFGYTDSITSQYYPGLLHNMTSDELHNTINQPQHAIYSDTQQLYQYNGEQYTTTYKSLIDHKHRVSIWNTLQSNYIHGSEGEVFNRNDIKPNSVLTTYIPEAFRTMLIHNINNTIVRLYEISLYRYITHHTVYQNAATYPGNSVYNSYSYNGLLNMSAAYQHMPIYISQPLYHQADNDLQNSVIYNLYDNITYNDIDLMSYLDIDPITGLTMRAHKRYQININIKPMDVNDQYIWFGKLNKTVGQFMPLVYIDQYGSISSNNANMINRKLYNFIFIATTFNHILVSSAVICMLLTIYSIYKISSYKHDQNKYSNNNIDIDINNIDESYRQRLLG